MEIPTILPFLYISLVWLHNLGEFLFPNLYKIVSKKKKNQIVIMKL